MGLLDETVTVVGISSGVVVMEGAVDEILDERVDRCDKLLLLLEILLGLGITDVSLTA
jgi:hypothetical protein